MVSKNSVSKKFIALFLAVVLTVVSFPLGGVLFAFAADDGFAFEVKCGETAIENAKVTVTATSGENKITENAEYISDKDGLVRVPEIDEYLANNADAEISIVFTVSADGYYYDAESSRTATVTAEKVKENVLVSMVKNPTVSYTVTKDFESNVKVYYLDAANSEVGIESGTSLPIGTKVYVRASNVEKNTLNISEKENNSATVKTGGVYEYTLGEKGLDISVEYQPLVYTIKVNINDANGGVVSPNPVKIVKTEETTDVTVTPNEGYIIAEVKLDDNDLTVSDGKYTIKNSEVNDKSELSVVFEWKKYTVTVPECVTIDGEYDKIENKKAKTVTYTGITYGTTLNFKVNTPKDEYISEIKMDGAPIEIGQAVVENSFSREIKNTKTDITFEVSFDTINIEKYKDAKYEEIYSVMNGKNEVKPTDGIYYVKGGSEVTLSYKKANEDIKNYDVCSAKNNRNKANGETTNWFNKNASYKTSVSDNIQPLQLIEKYNEIYFVPGTIKIRVDSKAPDITVDEYNQDWTNESQKITFSVADPKEAYNIDDDNEELYASGVKSVTVSRSYVKDRLETKENIDVNESSGAYSFIADKIDDYTGEVTYTITATDNVGNSSTQTLTIKNDTQAPVLGGKDGKDGNIEFKVEKTNIFERVIDSVLYGRWIEKKFEATLTANDQDGVGFENEKSSATLILKDADGNPKYTFTAGINEEGNAEFTEDLPEDWKTFTGTIEYTLSDDLGNNTESILVTKENSNITPEFSSIMIENNAPESTEIMPEPLNAETGKSNDDIFNGNIKFTVGIQDTESGLYSVEVKINDNNCDFSDTYTDNDTEKTDKYKESVHYFNQSQSADTLLHTLTFDTDGITPAAIEVENEETKEKETKFGYKVVVTVCDNAGNVETQTRTVYKDTTAPVISGFDFGDKKDNLPAKVEQTSYGFFFKDNVTVTVKALDDAGENEVASGVKAIVAYAKDISGNVYCVKENNYTLPTTDDEYNDQNENYTIPVDSETNSISFIVPANFKGQIYAYAIDNVENDPKNSTFDFDNECVIKDNTSQFYGCVHPDGAVIENADKHRDTSSIEITMPETSYSQAYSNSFTDADENRKIDNTLDYDTAKNVPLYSGNVENADVTATVTVTDSYSGIKSVKCVLKGNGKGDQIIASYPSDNDKWTVNDETIDINLVTEVSKEITIEGNHNDMVLEVILTDNAGNVSYDYVMFGIDTTDPDIAVTYDNNNGDTKSNNGITYFNADRTATVTISERNFDPSQVDFTIINAEGNAPEAVRIDEINDSTESTDETQHTYKVTYSGDGVYTFDVKCKDRAGNGNAEVKYGESVAPTSFVLDKTMPTISVSYDNNSAANGKFFNAHRTATIVVNEHNFDVNRVVITGTASVNGAAKTFPSAVWTSNGDVHTATISYNEDADYTFAIAMDDMAGNAITDASVNYGTSVAAKDFTVDTDIAKPVISNPANGQPYQDTVPVSISSSDVNLEKCEATLLKTGREKDENDTWKWVKDFRVDNVINLSNDGQTSSFSIDDLFEHTRLNDGIYTLKVDVLDKAGNTQSETVTFTVNRFGSVYDYNQYTTDTLNGKYVQAVTENIVITEYNPSPLSENAVISLTRDGAPVEISDSNLVITPVYTESATGASGWYEYKYEISKNVFSTVDSETGSIKYLDGIYKLYVTSKDIANNDSENISAGADMSFSLDSTAPIIASITGLEKKTVNDVKQDVSYEIFDAIGIDTIEVTYFGVNGETTETYNIGDMLKSYDPATQSEKPDITKYDGSFTIGEGMNNIVRIVAKDLAGNVMDTGDPNVENSAINFDDSVLAFNSMITVSTNPFVRWYSHTVFFWISIAVIVIALGACGYLIAVKLRKKEEKETEDYKNSKKNNK